MLCNLDYRRQHDVACVLDEGQVLAACEAVLAAEQVHRACFVSVSVVDERRMRELNRTWRGVDRATDVISLECERPDDPDLGEDEPCELGDIVLAPDYIRRQAQSFGVTERDETTLLLVHGMLHLLGYDHLEDAEAEVMEAREDEILDALGSAPGARLTRHRDEADA